MVPESSGRSYERRGSHRGDPSTEVSSLDSSRDLTTGIYSRRPAAVASQCSDDLPSTAHTLMLRIIISTDRSRNSAWTVWISDCR